jgi:predicted nucleic acid-binding protein
MIRVFLDSSAFFSAIVSSTGAARELIRLAVNEEIQLVISDDVVKETRRNIMRKAPELSTLLDRLLEGINFELVSSPDKTAVWAAETYVAQKDAFIIAAAIDAQVDQLATFDRKHLIDPPEVSEKSGLNIGTPGDILNEIRRTSN